MVDFIGWQRAKELARAEPAIFVEIMGETLGARSCAAALCLLALLLAAGCANEPTSGAEQRNLAVPEQSMADVSRGRLLYRNTCATCHSEQAHWREKSVVHTWSGLLFQVTRWQNIAGQQWRPQDIEDVAAYLNRRFYQLPCPVPGCAGDGLVQSADQEGNS
jgi:mono/diheme cytochrome c family protein